MPLPAMAGAAAPWILSAIGSAIPVILEAAMSSESPEEAAERIRPEQAKLVAQFRAMGLDQAKAEAAAESAIRPKLEKAMKGGGGMHPAVAIGGSILGGLLGWKGGAMLGAGKALAGKAAGKAGSAGMKTQNGFEGDTLATKSMNAKTKRPVQDKSELDGDDTVPMGLDGSGTETIDSSAMKTVAMKRKGTDAQLAETRILGEPEVMPFEPKLGAERGLTVPRKGITAERGLIDPNATQVGMKPIGGLDGDTLPDSALDALEAALLSTRGPGDVAAPFGMKRGIL